MSKLFRVVATFLLLVGSVAPSFIYAADTGLQVPTTLMTPNEWTVVGHVQISDNIYGVYTNDDGAEQGFGDFGFVIPTGATIDGIKVQVEAYQEGIDCALDAMLSWDGGITYTTPFRDTPTTADTVLVYGGNTELWGRTWTPDEVTDANFRVKLQFIDDPEFGDNCWTQQTEDAKNHDIFLDQVQVQISYTECTDTDDDGFCDELDNCPEISNQDQTDSDKDGIGDACEPVSSCADLTVDAKDHTRNSPLSTITVASGDVVTITAAEDDTWAAGTGDRTSNANGLVEGNTYGGVYPLVAGFGFPYGALVGRIGTGEYFLVGTAHTFTATQEGVLQLAFSDAHSLYNDNLDSIVVTLGQNDPTCEGEDQGSDPSCGDQVVDEGEACDGTENCTDTCECDEGYIAADDGECILDDQPTETCLDNIVVNGSFEGPVVAEDWQIFPTPAGGWDITKVSDDSPAGLEIQTSNLWTPANGNQYAELDSNESNWVSQTLTTVPGETYTLSFAFSPRPSVVDNALEVYWNGVLVGSGSADGSALSDTNWQVYSFDVVATGTSSVLAFKDTTPSDSYGTLLDNVSACPQGTVDDEGGDGEESTPSGGGTKSSVGPSDGRSTPTGGKLLTTGGDPEDETTSEETPSSSDADDEEPAKTPRLSTPLILGPNSPVILQLPPVLAETGAFVEKKVTDSAAWWMLLGVLSILSLGFLATSRMVEKKKN